MEDKGASILVVDDDAAVGRVLSALLKQAGLNALYEASAEAALKKLNASAIDLVITDLRMPGMDGMQLLEKVRQEWPDIPVIMLTAHGTVPIAVRAMKAGAADFVLKPFDREEVLYSVNKALASTRRIRSLPPPRAMLPEGFIGESDCMRELAELIRRAAQSAATVLLRGESGTGKELAVQAIHRQSARGNAPFVAVHCAALPETLLESELFGYEKGAFTGAVTSKPGRMELAEGGVLFLDEIGDLPLSMQVKLLRLLQEKEYQRLGSTRAHKADVRFIAATNKDLEEMVTAGEFREDLFYRLNVLSIRLPPLRERASDIPLLARYFCRTLAEQNQQPVAQLDDAALELLSGRPWPGNVRQLQNFIERLVVLSDQPTIGALDVQREIRGEPSLSSSSAADSQNTGASGAEQSADLKSQLQQTERDAVLAALKKANQNRSLAARILGVSRRTLYNKIAELGLQ